MPTGRGLLPVRRQEGAFPPRKSLRQTQEGTDLLAAPEERHEGKRKTRRLDWPRIPLDDVESWLSPQLFSCFLQHCFLLFNPTFETTPFRS